MPRGVLPRGALRKRGALVRDVIADALCGPNGYFATRLPVLAAHTALGVPSAQDVSFTDDAGNRWSCHFASLEEESHLLQHVTLVRAHVAAGSAAAAATARAVSSDAASSATPAPTCHLSSQTSPAASREIPNRTGRVARTFDASVVTVRAGRSNRGGEKEDAHHCLAAERPLR